MKLSGFGAVLVLVMLVAFVHAGVGTRALEEVDVQVQADVKDAQPQEKVSQGENQITSDDSTSSEDTLTSQVESTENLATAEESENKSVENSDSAENFQQNDTESKEGEENVAEVEEAPQSEKSTESEAPVEEATTKEQINSAKVPENNQQNEGTTDAVKEQEQENPQNKQNEQPQNEDSKQQEASSGYFQMSLSFVVLLFGGVFAFFVGFYRYSLNKYRIAPFSPPSFCPNFLFPRPESSVLLDDYYNQDLEMTNGFGNHKYHAII